MRTISLVFILLVSACASGNETEVDAQREIWADWNASSYTYELSLECFCGEDFRGPFFVTISDGIVESIIRVSSESDPVTVNTFVDGSIESIFELIENNADADSIAVTYDEQLGYPTTVILDPSFNTLDDETNLYVRDLRVMDGM